ncbi:MAG: hypothetical protein ABW168_21655 [Sedimenticola sp.]
MLHKWIDENGEEQEHPFDLRRIVIWNLRSKRRACGLCWDGDRGNDIREERKQMPERIDAGQLQNYHSFKKIDNEGKNLFDFVTASVWNVRRTLIDWLGEYYAKESDRVDLFYAILHSHGWINSDDQWVTVCLEPLQQPNRRHAQELLCRKLTGLGAKIPCGKSLRIEVGSAPSWAQS